MEEVGLVAGEGGNVVCDTGSGINPLSEEGDVGNGVRGEVSVEEINTTIDGFTTPPAMRGEFVCQGSQFFSPSAETMEAEQDCGDGSGFGDVEAPCVGMVFKTWEDVEFYYKEYAQEKGFGVSRVAGVYSNDGVRNRVALTWRCECWGRPDMRAVREAKKRAKAMEVGGTVGVAGAKVCEDELSKRKRKSKKCECKAMIYARRCSEGGWVIRRVELQHTNHSPKPDDAQLVKEYRMRKLTSSVRRKLLKYYDKGVPISQILGCLENDTDVQERLRLTVKDLQHEVYKAKRLRMVGGDSAAMMAYFEQMQADHQNFYHAQRLDDMGRLKDVFWVDARSRAAYEEFGDVVCFDATYLTNKYDLPFANFVGVNHHGQSILLGCALVSHEDCDTFTWVFNQWLSCMNNRAPVAILTDQAAAMRKPLEETMPNTRHRWCIWHIMKKIPEKLGKCAGYDELKKELKVVVYESLDIQEFESRWKDFISKYKLQRNEWLSELYKERHMWVPAFMKEYFWAGMKTTQRVESINSFFDGFLTRSTKLYEFPLKYAQAMRKRVRDEADADANCSKYIRRLATGYKVEKIFQKIYTDCKFQEVQTECIRMNYCYPREVTTISDQLTQYVVEDRVWIVLEGSSEEIITERRRKFSLLYNNETREVSCECRKFETHGIMCKHMMRVLDLNMVFDIPSKYILNRWRKDVFRKHTLVKVAYHDPSETTEVKRHNKLISAFEPICDAAAMVDDETVDIVLKTLRDLVTIVSRRQAKKLEQTIGMNYPGEGHACVQSVSDGADGFRIDASGQQSTHEADLGFNLQSTPQTAIGNPPPKKRGRGRPKGSRNRDVHSTPTTVVQDPVPIKRGRGRPKGSRNRDLHSTPTTVVEDPVPIKRGRGRPKGSRKKTLQEIGYKIPARKKAKKQGKLKSNRSGTRTCTKTATCSFALDDDQFIGLDEIPEDDSLLQYSSNGTSTSSQSF